MPNSYTWDKQTDTIFPSEPHSHGVKICISVLEKKKGNVQGISVNGIRATFGPQCYLIKRSPLHGEEDECFSSCYIGA